MGCAFHITPWTPYYPRSIGNVRTNARMIVPGCSKGDILNLLREASRCVPRSPEGISYSFKKIR